MKVAEPTTPRICVPGPAECESLAELLALTFGLPVALAHTLIEMHGPDGARVVLRRHEVAAGLLLDRAGQCWGGRIVPAALISGVAVALHARRQGLAGALLRASLADLRLDGVAVAVLYASNDAMYRGMGFEHAGLSLTVEAPPEAFCTSAPRELPPVIALHDSDLARVLYRSEMVRQDGSLDRTEAAWAHIAGEHLDSPAEWLAVPGPEGTLRGYLAYTLSGTGQDRHATVTDFVAADPQAAAALRAVLSRLGPLVRKVRLNTAPDDLVWWGLTHPVPTPLRAQPWMLRVLDPVRAVSKWGFPAAADARLSVTWRDPLFPEDDGDYTLAVSNGRGRLSRGGGGGLPMSPRPLAALLAGRASARTLRLAGTGTWSAAHDTLLESVFVFRNAWMRDRF